MYRRVPIGLIVCLACLVLPPRHLHVYAASMRAAPISIAVEIGGVGVSLSVAPGPYFLGETVPVTTTVSNGSGGEIAVENDGNRGLDVIATAPGYAVPTATYYTLDTNDTLPTDQCNRQAANHVAL